MRIEIVCVGTELLNGRVSDKNSQFLIHELGKLGYPVNLLTIVNDDENYLEYVFNAALARSDIIIVSGGLGSTHDDLTKRYVAKVFNRKLTLSNEILDDIKKKYEQNQIEMPATVQKQALIPRKSILISNKHGTAPGFICQENERVFICLPGVPKELVQMWTDEVRPFLIQKFGNLASQIRLLARTCGLMEMDVNDLLSPFFQQDGLTWTLMAGPEGVDIEFFLDPVRCEAHDYDAAKLKKDVKSLLGSALYIWGDASMEEIVGRLLTKQGLSLAVAESCTGGLISHRLTQVPGSSKYFERGFVTYSNRSKQELLGVKAAVLEEHGAVSSHVAREMAIGARQNAGTQLGLSTTGIAGPDGGSSQKPVGLVYCALSSSKECSCQSFRFMGDRDAIKMQCSQASLNILRQYLEKL